MIALSVLDGPTNADAFITYVNRVFMPELGPGYAIVIDNPSSHKAPAIRAAIEGVGARLLLLLAYSPTSIPSSSLLQAESGFAL